jgi:class 3 adenylate cyclase
MGAMEPQYRFCTSADGTRISYATFGEGAKMPLLLVESWYYSQLAEWGNPRTRALLEHLANGRMLITFDRRGVGSSQREVDDVSIERQIEDQVAVVDHLGVERFDILGYDPASSVVYAARHSQRVARMVIWSPLAQHDESKLGEANTRLADLARRHWSAYRRLIATDGFPNGPADLQRWFSDMVRDSISPRVAAKYIELGAGVNIRPLLPQVQAPTLVLHAAGVRYVPAEASQEVAALIPGARFVEVEEDPAFIFFDPARFAGIVLGFLDGEPATRLSARLDVASSLAIILFTDLASSTALTQRLGDAKAQELVRAHNAIVREALAAQDGTEIKHTGDGIMASFPTASGALECAIALQRAVEAQNREPRTQNRETFQVHVGLNAGEPVAEESDLFGTSVQLARRICDHATAGQILTSNVVRELAAGKGFLFADIGEVVAKGFEEPVRLYEVRWREDE